MHDPSLVYMLYVNLNLILTVVIYDKSTRWL